MAETPRIVLARDNTDFRIFVEATLAGLSRFYLTAYPQKEKEAFFIEIFEPMCVEKNISGDFYINEAHRMRDANQPCNLKFVGMLASCAYLVEAGKWFKEDDMDKAWSFIADARYWCGVTTASQSIDESYKETIIQTRQDTGRSGGKAKSNKNVAIKEKAFELARLRRPPEKGWRSRTQAANKIYSEVLEFAKMQPNAQTFSRDKFPITLRDWLAEMPDASFLFSNRKEK